MRVGATQTDDRAVDPVRIARLGLRARTLVSFGLIAIVTSLLAGVATYSFSRSNLVDQRIEATRTQAFANAQLMRTYLQSRRNLAGSLITTIRTETRGYAVLRVTPQNFFYASDPLRFTQTDLPESLTREVSAGRAATQRFDHDGELYQAIGVPMPAVGADYYEVFPLRDTQRTLGFILSALLAGLIVATATATSLGWFTSRRLLRPVRRVADAAADIAGFSVEVPDSLGSQDLPSQDALDGDFRLEFEVIDGVRLAIDHYGGANPTFRISVGVTDAQESDARALLALKGNHALPDSRRFSLDPESGLLHLSESLAAETLSLDDRATRINSLWRLMVMFLEAGQAEPDTPDHRGHPVSHPPGSNEWVPKCDQRAQCAYIDWPLSVRSASRGSRLRSTRPPSPKPIPSAPSA